MVTGRAWVTLAAVAIAASGCGRSDGPADEAVSAIEPAAVGEMVQEPRLAVPRRESPAAVGEMVQAPGLAAPRRESPAGVRPLVQELDQPAIWPSADVVFATPEEAATDFVSEALISEGDPLLGDFQQGDARSGEIAVLFGGETGDADPPFEKGTLLLRQLGPDGGWFVIGAVSDGATIDAPVTGAAVPAGPLVVSGEGRGFESTLVVSAFSPGDTTAQFDQEIGAGGAFEELEPYSVTLDLSDGAPGETIVILVQGDTGLGSDPSTFAALPVVIEDVIPPTR